MLLFTTQLPVPELRSPQYEEKEARLVPATQDVLGAREPREGDLGGLGVGLLEALHFTLGGVDIGLAPRPVHNRVGGGLL